MCLPISFTQKPTHKPLKQIYALPTTVRENTQNQIYINRLIAKPVVGPKKSCVIGKKSLLSYNPALYFTYLNPMHIHAYL